MKLAILSGKGGTGKTFISVNLSSVMNHSCYVDCDVEEPNGALFLKPAIEMTEDVSILIPEFQEEMCVGCKKCIEACKFHALAFVKDKPLLFPEICHSCGVCANICKHNAVIEVKRKIGVIQHGSSGNQRFLEGKLNLGEASGVPIIHKLLKELCDDLDIVIDCPPGSGCSVMESMKHATFCLIVAEPTEYGKQNLEMICDLVHVFHKPFAIVLNKYLNEQNPVEDFCEKNGIQIIAKIPFDKNIAMMNGMGNLVVNESRLYRDIFDKLFNRIKERVI